MKKFNLKQIGTYMFVHQLLGSKSEAAAAFLANVVLELVVELLFARLQGVHFDDHFEVGRQISQLNQIREAQGSTLSFKKQKICLRVSKEM